VGGAGASQRRRAESRCPPPFSRPELKILSVRFGALRDCTPGRMFLREQSIEDCHMANSRERREQISVPLDPALRAAIERRAEAEHRSVASLIRHIVATALESHSEAAAA